MLKLQQHHQIQHGQGQFFGQSQAAQTAYIHNIEHLALGLLWLLGSALAASASHYLAHCAFASQQKGPKTWRLCHASSHMSAAQNWGFCTLRQGVRATVVYTKAHSPSKRTQLPWKQRQEMAEQLCSCCLWGIDSGMLPLTAHGNHLIWGWLAAKADLGTPPARQRGQARGCTLLPALSCTDTASQEQGLGCTESQSTPTLLCTTNTKMLYITIKQLLYVLHVKLKYSDLGILITVLYFNMTRFLRFTHNSAYPWVWRKLQYPYNTQP